MQLSYNILLSLMNLLKEFEQRVKKLYGKIRHLESELTQTQEQLEEANAEIRRLKKLPKKPDIKASELDKPKADSSGKTGKTGKRPGSDKVSRKKDLEIHEERIVKAQDVPTDWELVGYKDYVIQDFVIRANNISYQREVWQSPDGQQSMVASLPSHLVNKHFGTTLEGYILQQYYECGVTQPLILQSLLDFGVSISKGQISNILIENKARFHQKKESLLAAAIEPKEELRTDDTGARHQFRNGSCNCINSDLFTYFTTTYVKLKPYNDRQAQLLEMKKEAFWTLYQALKKYKQQPDETQIPILEQQFDKLCESVEGFESLNQVLEALKKKKDKLLLVLKRPRAVLQSTLTQSAVPIDFFQYNYPKKSSPN